jgi:hypothetical protein
MADILLQAPFELTDGELEMVAGGQPETVSVAPGVTQVTTPSDGGTCTATIRMTGISSSGNPTFEITASCTSGPVVSVNF